MRRICTICARGGSKGVKNKNFRDLAGKPLLAHTIEQANESNLFEEIAVSSDSPEILEVANKYGVRHLINRPAELATDTAAKLPVIVHCLKEVELKLNSTFDIIVDLDVTSPLRSVDDIIGSVALLETKKVSNVITASPARRSPYFNLVELGEDDIVRLSKKLDKPIVRRHASIYVWTRQALIDFPTVFNFDTRLFVMPEERSVDIDNELDFEIVEFLMMKKLYAEK